MLVEANIQNLIKRVIEITNETKTLYEISEAEMFLMVDILTKVSQMNLSLELTAKLLRATTHFVEATDEMNKNFCKDSKR